MTTTGLFVAAWACGTTSLGAAAAVVLVQDLSPGERWTVLGLLAGVVLGGGKLLISGVVTAIRDLGKDQKDNTKVLADLLTEIKLQAQANATAHAAYASARDAAVGDVIGAIENIPTQVVDEIDKRENELERRRNRGGT